MKEQKVFFLKPDIKTLRREGYTCVDMHYHTTHSDGAASVDQLLEKSRKIGIGIAITDHNTISGAQEAFQKAKKTDFIIPGIEVKSIEMVDILFYFYNIKDMKKFYETEILPNKEKYLHTTRTRLKLKDILLLQKKYKSIISVAHPFGYMLRGGKDIFFKNEEILRTVEIFEVINGGNSRKQNLLSVEYSIKNNKCFTGGTDGHSIYPLGNIVTCAKAKNLSGFLDAIKNNSNIVVGNENEFGKFGEIGRVLASKIKGIFSK